MADIRPTSIVDYASAVTFELRQSTSGGPLLVRLNFKNGSDAEFTAYNMFGKNQDVELSEFTSRLSVSKPDLDKIGLKS
jgi:hypothetical protein